MYIGALVVTWLHVHTCFNWFGWVSRVLLLFVYGRVVQPRYICDVGKYRTMVHYQILCDWTNLPQRNLLLQPKLMEMPIYRELWFLSGTKLSKRAEKMLKTTLVLEDQSRQQMIKRWKWCELWWQKNADWVSGWLQKKRAWIKMRFIEF